MKISYIIDGPSIKVESTEDCNHGGLASIAAYNIMLLAQENKVLPDEIVADLLRLVKSVLKQANA